MTDGTDDDGERPDEDADSGTVSIRTHPHGSRSNALRVEVAGDLDLFSAPHVGEALEAACFVRSEARTEPVGAQDILMDLRQVNVIDSAALALLVRLRKRMGNLCRFVLLLTPGTQTERIIRLANIDRAIPVVVSPEAFDALRGPDNDNQP